MFNIYNCVTNHVVACCFHGSTVCVLRSWKATHLQAEGRRARSKVTNGALFASDLIDGRSASSRRFRDVLGAIVGDLGGSDRLSEAQRQLARRVALMSIQCEAMEERSIAGQEIDIDLYGTLTDRIGRAAQRIGLRRVPRNITPSPLEAHFARPATSKVEACALYFPSTRRSN